MLRHMGYNSVISNDEKEIRDSTHIILPGVGSFGNAMKKINNLIPIKILENEVFKQKKPFLGICVGMQILAEKGFEHGENVGLGWIKGNVIKMQSKKRVTKSDKLPRKSRLLKVVKKRKRRRSKIRGGGGKLREIKLDNTNVYISAIFSLLIVTFDIIAPYLQNNLELLKFPLLDK